MPLSDLEIISWAEQDGISPYFPEDINPASIDLRLGCDWIDFEDPKHKIQSLSAITLYPRTLRVELHNMLCKWLPIRRKPTAILAITRQWIRMPSNVAGEIKLKTTPTRKGLGHPIADWIDPGYNGRLTLMLHAVKEIRLAYNQKICQLVLWPMNQAAYNPYAVHGHYMNQAVPMIAWDEEIHVA